MCVPAVPAAVRAARSSSMVERDRDIQRNRKTDQRPPSWLQQQKLQPVQVKQLPEIEKLPPMPPLPVSDKQNQQERSILGKLTRLLLWWRSEAKPKHVKASYKERKMKKKSSPKEKKEKSKGKSPCHNKTKKSQGKGTTSGKEPLPTHAQEGGGNVHNLTKKFTTGFSGGSSPSVVKEASASVPKGSVASAVQRLEENIKEKQGIDLTDYEEPDGGEEYQEVIELGKNEEENEEALDENEELKVSHLSRILQDSLSRNYANCSKIFSDSGK